MARREELGIDVRAREMASAELRRVGGAVDDIGNHIAAAEADGQRFGRTVRDITLSLNSLSGRNPAQLAEQLDRAALQADEAFKAIGRVVHANEDLSPKEAQKYADALNEIQVEADQTVADLRELQRADPRFDTAELQRAATLLDDLGDEASELSGELNRMGKGDTGLERVSREARHAAGELDHAESRTKRFQGALGGLKSVIVGLGVAFGLREAIGQLNDAVEATSALQQAGAGMDVVLGDAADTVRDFANTSAESLGLSRREVAQHGAVLGAQLQSLGFDAHSSADEVVRLEQRAADMAATFGGKTSDAVLAVSAVLRGERDTIEKYGVSLKEADVQARILALGLDTSTAEAKKNAVAVASLSLVMEQTARISGMAGRQAGEYAGQQRALGAEWENAQAQLGEDLMPLFKEFFGFLRDPGIPIFRSVIGVVVEFTRFLGIQADQISDFVRMMQIRFGDMGATVEDRANEIGVDVGEMKDHVIFAMNEMGMGIDAAMTYAEQRMAGLPVAATSAMLGTVAAWKEADIGAMDAASRAMAEPLARNMQESQDEAVAVVRQTPGALAGALRAGIDDYDAALTELTDVATKSVSDLAERQKIEGILASQELTDALNSDSTRTRMLAADLVSDLISDYELLAPGAFASGALVNPALYEGGLSNIQLARDMANAIVDAAGNPLVELGPLGYDWGATLGRRFRDGLSSYWGAIAATSRALGDAAAVGIRLRSPAKEGALSEDAASWTETLMTRWLGPLWAAVPKAGQVSLAIADAAAGGLRATFGGPPLAPAMIGGGGGGFGQPRGFGGGPLVHIEHFHGTEENVRNLARELGAYLGQ